MSTPGTDRDDPPDDRAGTSPTVPVPVGVGGIALTTIVGAEFVLQLDGQIVTIALPSLQSGLGTTITTATWAVTGFGLAFGALLLVAGRLSDTIGQRRTFLVGIAALGLGSLVAGLVPTFELLMVGRVIQGAGSALAGPSGLSLLATLFTGERQQRAFGLFATVAGMGASAGLVLGGVLTSSLGWRWCLLLNVPIAVAILLAARTAIPSDAPAPARPALALPSAAGFTAALTALVLGLTRAAEHGWTDPWVIGVLLAAVGLAAVVVPLDQRGVSPLLPRRVFASRDRVVALLNLVPFAAVLTGFVIYLSQYLQGGLGFDALRTGLAMVPFALAILVTTQFLTGPLQRLAPRARVLLGLALMLGALGWLTGLDAHSHYAPDILGPIVVLGAGVGIAMVPFDILIMTTGDPADAGIAGGLLQTALITGGAIGVAALLTPFTAGTGGPGDTISTVFVAAAATMAAQILLTLLAWFGPRRRPA